MSDRADGWAAGIFEVAKAEDALDDVAGELFELSHVLTRSDELRKTLSDASLPAEKRQAIVEDLLGDRASPLTAAIVSFVVAAGRARELGSVAERLVERAASERQHVVAEVRSAVPLSGDQRERLAEALSANLDKQVEVRVIVDPSVLGGLSARVGDIVIDGTVRRRLDQLREVRS